MFTVTRVMPAIQAANVDDCVLWWRRVLGFSLIESEVDEAGLKSALVRKDACELMVERADPTSVHGASVLVVEVESVVELERALGGEVRVLSRRKGALGATEFGVRDPAGTLVIFVEPPYEAAAATPKNIEVRWLG